MSYQIAITQPDPDRPDLLKPVPSGPKHDTFPSAITALSEAQQAYADQLMRDDPSLSREIAVAGARCNVSIVDANAE